MWGFLKKLKLKLPCMLVTQSCPSLCDPMDCSLPWLLCPWNSSGKNTGVGWHSLLQGVLLIQGSNLSLLHCRHILYYLSHQGNPAILLLGIYLDKTLIKKLYTLQCSYYYYCCCCHFSRVRVCATPSLGFSRQEHWSGLPFPSPMHKSEK